MALDSFFNIRIAQPNDHLSAAQRSRSPRAASELAQRHSSGNPLLGGTRDGREGNSSQWPASDSRNATISWPLRAGRTSPTRTGWFQVLPSIAGNRASSVN